MRNQMNVFVALVAAAALTVGVGGRASAADPVPNSSVASLKFCGYVLEAQAQACFATAGERDTWLSQESGRNVVVVANGDTKAVSAALVADDDFLLGILYEDADYGGASFAITGPSQCDSNKSTWEYGLSYVGAAWNDRTSSFQGFANCQVKVFDNQSYGGTSLGPLAQSSNAATAMNDRTSSVQFY